MKKLSSGQFWLEKNLNKRKILAREKSWQEKNLGMRKITAREKFLQEKNERGKDIRGIKGIRTRVMKDILAIDKIFDRGMMGLKK